MAEQMNAAMAEQSDFVVMLARSLFRADKWDPDRNPDRPFEWDDQRLAYLKKSRRLLNVMGKDGMALAMSEGAQEGVAG